MSALDFSITVPSCDLSTIIDFLATLYEAGMNLKRAMMQTLIAWGDHRSFEIRLFGGSTTNRPMHSLSYSGQYCTWRDSVLATLRSPAIPKYSMLKFMATPDVLIEPCYESASRETLFTKATANLNKALTTLLDIIKELTQLKSYEPDHVNTLTPPKALPMHDLRAEMESRRLVIHAGAYTLVSKHRLAYNGNPHKLLKSMVSHKGQELTREQAGLPANLKISNVVQGIGFKGLIHRKLLDSGINTVMLKEGVLINDHELRQILEGCQDSFDLQ
ncbi:MAG TPA: hypothetical protein VFT53_03560 [Candidatus Saccharimonadales bacterium]|nr:hypothetical protein [Candidatus Saccharimonadales bacterium]